MFVKDFTKYLNIFENYDQHLDQIVNMTSGKQKEYYSWIREQAKEVQISPAHEVLGLSEKEVKDYLKRFCTQKQCYSNSTRIMDINPNIEYVEGTLMMMGAIPIDHAWNKLGDQYFDVTSYYFNQSSPGDSYWSVLELSQIQLTEILSETGTYGDIIRWWWINKINQ